MEASVSCEGILNPLSYYEKSYYRSSILHESETRPYTTDDLVRDLSDGNGEFLRRLTTE